MTRLFTSLKAWFNPLDARGGFVIPHLVLLTAIAGAFAIGVGVGRTTSYDAAYFAQKYADTGLHSWVKTAAAPKEAPIKAALPAVQTVNLTYYWAGGNQGQWGQCAGWSAAKAYTYLFRKLHYATHPAIRFSPQWFWDYYVDLYNFGQDGGSIQTEDLKVVAIHGAVQYKLYPSAVAPTYPFPTNPTLLANAALHQSPITTQTLYMGNPSDVVYDEIKQALAMGQVAMLAINVPPSFDNATQTGGRIWYPGPEASRGGHAINAIQVDDTMAFPDGSVGGVKVDNQWSSYWSINDQAWVSRKWLANNAWGVMVISGGVNAHT